MRVVVVVVVDCILISSMLPPLRLLLQFQGLVWAEALSFY
jgi:hypothetical protein